MEEDLIILATYINVAGLTKANAENVIMDFVNSHRGMYNDVLTKKLKMYYIPIKTGESRIECIYPIGKSCSEVDTQIINLYKALLNSTDEQIKDFIQELERKINLIKSK